MSEVQYKEIIISLFIAKIEKDFGTEGLKKALFLADKIRDLFKFIYVGDYDKIIAVTPITITDKLYEEISAPDCQEIIHFEHVQNLGSKELYIEFSLSGKIFISKNATLELSTIKDKAIIYEKEGDFEFFHTKLDRDLLTPINGIESYFSSKTFSNLNDALEFYKVNFAQNSSCKILQNIWNDDNRIKLIDGASEALMRDSLCQFLRMRLDDVREIMPEQNVNEKNPVDIKVFWNFSKHIALIEIKWLGKSISNVAYSQARANKGAKQLADYIDEYKIQEPTNISKGYLVVFDARRRKVDCDVSVLTRADLDHYSNREIEYNPDYNVLRNDFERPKRFFLKAKLPN